MKRTTILTAAGFLTGVILAAGSALAQVAFSSDGLIESTSGGFKFPDGTVQATAAVAAASADTGQTQCFDAAGMARACGGTGEDGETQAGVTWPTPRFTDNGNGTITDNLTKLIWLKDGSCSGSTLLWQAALTWVANFNGGSTACADYGAGTHADWRVPNIRELFSLLDFGNTNPPLPAGHPFVNFQSNWYHTSTSNLVDPTGSFAVRFTDGDIGSGAGGGKTTFANWVLPVRGPE